MSKTYTLPNTDISVTCEYSIKRNQDVVLGDCYIDDQQIDTDALFVKVTPVSLDNRFMRDEKFFSLSEYFQQKLDDDASEIIAWEYDDTMAAE